MSPPYEGSPSRSRRGECIAILGQNGSGKSTLVRLLSTLLLPDGGTARIYGHDIGETRAVRTMVNRVSVEASFFKKMSATENLAYAARFYGLTPRETRARIPVILDRVGFPVSRRTHSMENLSRGTQQKVALARALLTSPVLLLLDEPTTGLDPRSKLEVQDFIREVRTIHDTTILLCTHDLAEAEILAERIGILDDGQLLCLEPADEIKDRYGVETLEEAFFAATGRTFEDERERRGRGGERMTAIAARARHELIGLLGVVERNWYLVKRYAMWELAFFVWTIANTLSIVFISKAAGLPPDAGERADHRAADRRRDLGVPRDHLRDPHRDGRVGALGGDDRVHVHGAPLPAGAPDRHGPVRDRVRARPRDADLRGGRGDVRAAHAGRELRHGADRCSASPRSRSSGSG